MSDIFISYAKEDLERVKPLVRALEEVGWSVWWDRSIRAGKTWDDVIQEAIDNARCMIVLWSRDSVESEWVRIEAAEGRQRCILVPALLDNVKIPLAFKRMQAASLIGWKGAISDPLFSELREAVSDVIGATVGPVKDRPEPPLVVEKKEVIHQGYGPPPINLETMEYDLETIEYYGKTFNKGSKVRIKFWSGTFKPQETHYPKEIEGDEGRTGTILRIIDDKRRTVFLVRWDRQSWRVHKSEDRNKEMVTLSSFTAIIHPDYLEPI